MFGLVTLIYLLPFSGVFKSYVLSVFPEMTPLISYNGFSVDPNLLLLVVYFLDERIVIAAGMPVGL